MARREIETMDRSTWAVWDARLGIVADITKMTKKRWAVEDYYSGVVTYFKTQSQAIHYATQLPDNS